MIAFGIAVVLLLIFMGLYGAACRRASSWEDESKDWKASYDEFRERFKGYELNTNAQLKGFEHSLELQKIKTISAGRALQKTLAEKKNVDGLVRNLCAESDQLFNDKSATRAFVRQIEQELLEAFNDGSLSPQRKLQRVGGVLAAIDKERKIWK